MDYRRPHHPQAPPPKRPNVRRRARSPLRDELRTRGYAAGRALVSPDTKQEEGGYTGTGRADLGPFALHGEVQDGVGPTVAVDGLDGQHGAGVAALGLDQLDVRTAQSDEFSAGLHHTRSGLGASLRATDATVHHAAVSGANAQVGQAGLGVSADHVSWLNTGASTASAEVHSADTGHRAQLDAQGLQVHKADVHQAALQANASGLRVNAAEVGFTNVAADRVGAQVTGRHSQTGLGASGVGIHETQVRDASLQADRSGLHVAAQSVDFTNLRADAVRAEHHNRAGRGHVAASNLAVHETQVGGATFDATRAGLDTHADSLDFVNTRATNLEGQLHTAGGAQGAISADSLSVHELGVRDADVHLGRRGIEAQAAAVNWQNTAVENAHASWSGAKGANGHAHADAIAAHTLAVSDGRFALNRHGVAARGGVDYTHARLQGLDMAHHAAGGTSLAAGVQDATVGAVSADEVALRTNLISGAAHVHGGRVVEHDLQGAHASWTKEGETLLGAKGDLHASHSVDAAKAQWDLGAGELSASVAGYEHDRSISDATITVLGEELEVPDMAVHLEADAEAALDIDDGELELGLDLSGSSLKVGDFEVSLPEQAQLGVDMDLSEGQLNLNIGGHEVDVDEAIGRVWGRLKGLFSGGKAKKASRKDIERGREELRALGRGMPRLKRDVRNAVELAKVRRAA